MPLPTKNTVYTKLYAPYRLGPMMGLVLFLLQACMNSAPKTEATPAGNEAGNEFDATGLYPLHRAAKDGDLEAVVSLLAKKIDPNIRSQQGGNTSLFLAVRYGQVEAVKVLAENGANLNLKNKYESTALHEAVQRGGLEMVKVLLDHGANPTLLGRFEDCEYTPLHLAINKGDFSVVCELLSRLSETERANILAKKAIYDYDYDIYSRPRTPIQLACQKYDKDRQENRKEIVLRLLRLVQISDVLEYAIENKFYFAISLILEESNTEQWQYFWKESNYEYKRTAAHLVIVEGEPEITLALVQKIEEVFSLEEMKELFAKNNQKQTPWDIVIQNREDLLCKLCLSRFYDAGCIQETHNEIRALVDKLQKHIDLLEAIEPHRDSAQDFLNKKDEDIKQDDIEQIVQKLQGYVEKVNIVAKIDPNGEYYINFIKGIQAKVNIEEIKSNISVLLEYYKACMKKRLKTEKAMQTISNFLKEGILVNPNNEIYKALRTLLRSDLAWDLTMCDSDSDEGDL